MKGLLKVVIALSMVALLAMPALAEVQNIKVSGGMVVSGLYRDNFSTTGKNAGRSVSGFSETGSADFYNTSAQIGIDADMTDNIAAAMKFGAERDWGAAVTGDTNIQIWSAYVTLKEMLYSPLTVKAGKMPMKIADGLIIGDGAITNQTNLMADELSQKRGFDTIHGILDYDPLTVVAGIIKISEAPQSGADDVDGYLVDGIYKFEDDMKTMLDVYLLNAHYSSPSTFSGPSGASTTGTDVFALAGTVNMEPMDKLSTKVGLAYQFGDFEKTTTVSRNLKAYAFDVDVNYALDSEYSPKVGVKYVYRSGQNAGVTTGDYKGWLPLFESQVNGQILDPNTNTASFAINGSMMPIDRLTLSAEVWFYQLAKKQNAIAASGLTDKKEQGMELDLMGKYAYTEDVWFGLGLAWFFPGDYYGTTTAGVSNDETAMQALLQMGLVF